MSPALKTWFLSVCVTICGVVGNALLSKGVKGLGPQAALLAFVVDPLVVTGVLLLIGWMLFRMALLSISPMSALLPLIAGVGYLLITLVGRFYLHEEVARDHYFGVLLIAAGVFLIGTSASKDLDEAGE